MTIDIIVPTYNRSSQLRLTLDSIYRQRGVSGHLRVIVADDGSADDTSDVARQYASLLHLLYVYQKDDGYRVVSARNLAIRICDADICLFVDAGVLLEANCIARHLRTHSESNSSVAVIGYVYGFDTEQSNGEALNGVIRSSSSLEELIDKVAAITEFRDVRDKEYQEFGYRFDEIPAPWVYFWTCHVSVDIAALQRVGMFDPIYEPHYGYEDVDLGYRLFKDGCKLVIDCQARAIHIPLKKKNDFRTDKLINLRRFAEKFGTEEINLLMKNGGTKGYNRLLRSVGIEGCIEH